MAFISTFAKDEGENASFTADYDRIRSRVRGLARVLAEANVDPLYAIAALAETVAGIYTEQEVKQISEISAHLVNTMKAQDEAEQEWLAANGEDQND